MGILTWIALGLIAGAITKAATPGRATGGFLIIAVVGVCGAFLGGYIGGYIGGAITDVGLTGVSLWSILLAVLGSLLLLGVYRVATRSRAR